LFCESYRGNSLAGIDGLEAQRNERQGAKEAEEAEAKRAGWLEWAEPFLLPDDVLWSCIVSSSISIGGSKGTVPVDRKSSADHDAGAAV
jgi:hypothetical protein